MRITNQMIHNRMLSILQTGTRGLMDAQEKVASQKRINRMSDDPIGSGKVLELRRLLDQNDQYLRNLEHAESWANLYDSTLDTVIEQISRGKELLLAQANDISASDQTRDAARVEMVSLLGGVLTSANSRLGSQYLFGGYHTQSQPFEDTTATAGAGPGNTGGAAVASTNVLDYVLITNEDYQIQFRDNAGTMEYDIYNVTQGSYASTGNVYTSGDAIRFNGIEIVVQDSPGAPTDGDVFDATTTPAGNYIGDSGNIQLELEKDKRQTVNLTGYSVFLGAGVSNGIDVFDMFNRAISALNESDSTVRDTALQTLIDEFDVAMKQMANFQSIAGSRQTNYGEIRNRLGSLDVSLQTLKSDVEDIDFTEAYTTMTQRETAFEASLNASSRVMQISLMDFLR